MPERNAQLPLVDWHEAPSFFQKANFLIAQYRVVVYAIFGVALWLGMKVVSPNQRITAVEKEQKAMRATLDKLTENSNAVVRLQCFNKAYKLSELRLAGIDCEPVNGGEFSRSR